MTHNSTPNSADKETLTPAVIRLTAAIESLRQSIEQTATKTDSNAEHGASSSQHSDALIGGRAYTWSCARGLRRQDSVRALPLNLLLGVDRQKSILMNNTAMFCRGRVANNALLWGARGCGKSALIRAIWLNACQSSRLKDTGTSVGGAVTYTIPALISLPASEIAALPDLMDEIASQTQLRSASTPEPTRTIVFCDDFSIAEEGTQMATLKSALQGNVADQPQNVLIYATSNRRHMVPRTESTEAGSEMFPQEQIHSTLALSDRFGIWLGFSNINEDEYLRIVLCYAKYLGLSMHETELKQQARLWARSRGNVSGRLAWQFTVEIAGSHDIDIAKLYCPPIETEPEA